MYIVFIVNLVFILYRLCWFCIKLPALLARALGAPFYIVFFGKHTHILSSHGFPVVFLRARDFKGGGGRCIQTKVKYIFSEPSRSRFYFYVSA